MLDKIDKENIKNELEQFIRFAKEKCNHPNQMLYYNTECIKKIENILKKIN